MKTAEEKKKEFLQRAKANLKNNDLHRELITKHIEPLYQHPFRGSIQYFEESGHVSGSFMLALMDYAESYASQSRWISCDERLPTMDLDKAEMFVKNTDYYFFTDESVNPINIGDASAFFLEGYKHALNLFELLLTSDWKPQPPKQ